MSAAGELRFAGEWRRYQLLALEAFERDRAAGRTSTHLVAPPGSGKTLLGFEILRRLAEPALVLAPNSAIQAQWTRTGARFGAPAGTVAAEPGAAVACLTYQALARLDDPGAALRAVAESRWAAERAAATGEDPAAVAAEAARWDGRGGAPAPARARAHHRVAQARDRALGGPDGGRLGDLLAPGARARVDALRAAGVRTVVLDECHHLASLWGYVVRAVLEELGDGVHVVGLTATPPDELTTEEAELYAALLGPVDFQVPTPAVVRDGHLAPYQELAWLTEPLERRAALARRARDALPRARDGAARRERGRPARPRPVGDHAAAPPRRAPGADEERGAVERLPAPPARRSPRAGVRFLASAGLPLPPGAPRGEAYRRPPDLDDWVVLLEDWVLRCLDAAARARGRRARARRSPRRCATSASR